MDKIMPLDPAPDRTPIDCCMSDTKKKQGQQETPPNGIRKLLIARHRRLSHIVAAPHNADVSGHGLGSAVDKPNRRNVCVGFVLRQLFPPPKKKQTNKTKRKRKEKKGATSEANTHGSGSFTVRPVKKKDTIKIARTMTTRCTGACIPALSDSGCR